MLYQRHYLLENFQLHFPKIGIFSIFPDPSTPFPIVLTPCLSQLATLLAPWTMFLGPSNPINPKSPLRVYLLKKINVVALEFQKFSLVRL